MNVVNLAGDLADAVPAGATAETVTEVQHYTDDLFRFRMTRPASFRFRSGEFVMIGLMVGDKPVFRAYSIASPSWDEELEFFSIKVPDGPLTRHLQKIKVGDKVLMKKKPTGTLVNDALISGKRLYMFSTGTGFAPFASLIRDPETYEKFEEVIVTHSCRFVAELAYSQQTVAATPRGSADRRARRRPAAPVHLHDARAARAHRPYHHVDRERRSVPRARCAAARSGNRPGDDLRLHGDAQGHQGAARGCRPHGRGQQPAGRVRHREGLRRLTTFAPLAPIVFG